MGFILVYFCSIIRWDGQFLQWRASWCLGATPTSGRCLHRSEVPPLSDGVHHEVASHVWDCRTPCHHNLRSTQHPWLSRWWWLTSYGKQGLQRRCKYVTDNIAPTNTSHPTTWAIYIIYTYSKTSDLSAKRSVLASNASEHVRYGKGITEGITPSRMIINVCTIEIETINSFRYKLITIHGVPSSRDELYIWPIRNRSTVKACS